jgi:NAD+ diphosphatase
VATATALLNWHDNARFSAVNGAPTKAVKAAGRGRPGQRARGVPPHRPGRHLPGARRRDRVALARQAVWPPRMFSLLAGFVEAGESFETCVEREIAEEIGLSVRDVRYLGSQPWPFPRSLMVGFHALADPDQEFSFNDGEIVEARWFTRDQVRAALAAGDWTNAETSDSELLLPGSVSIAREIIESWAHPEHRNNSASGRVCTPTRRCGCTNADARPDGSAQ